MDFFLVAISALEVLINAIVIEVRLEQESPQYFERLLENLKAVVPQLGAAQGDFLMATDRALEACVGA